VCRVCSWSAASAAITSSAGPASEPKKRLREKIRDRSGRNRCHADIRETIAAIKPIVRGWGAYFRTGNATRVFNAMDGYVVVRLRG
jgi:RNA-directed DNA polymerase